MRWFTPISTAPEGVTLMTKIDDANGERNIAPLRRSGRLWFYPDGSMYVYYTPTHWRELTVVESRRIEDEARAKAEANLQHTLAGLR